MPETFICNFAPSCCPNCGKKFKWDKMSLEDFHAHAAQTCTDCGAKFQCADADAIVRTAREAGGDL